MTPEETAVRDKIAQKEINEQNAAKVIAAHIADQILNDENDVQGFESFWHWLIPVHMRTEVISEETKEIAATISRSAFQNYTKGAGGCFPWVGWARAYWVDIKPRGLAMYNERVDVCSDILRCHRPSWTTIEFSEIAKAALK